MLGIDETEGSGTIDYDLNGVIIGALTISKDQIDLENTTDILLRYPDGRKVRFIREDLSLKKRLDLIERKVREVFDGTFKSNKERELYYRAQVLADIFAIFEYDGQTVKEDTDHD